MKITFLGTGTSQGVPVVACPCKVCRSGDPRDKRLRSSVMIEAGGNVIVIDTGPDFRQQMLREKVKNLTAVFLSHEHKDHIAGLDDVRAFNYVLAKSIDVYAEKRVQHALRREFKYVFDEEKYPGIPEITLHTISDASFCVNQLTVVPIRVMHYKLPILGFRINNFTYITDANYISDRSKDQIRGSKVLVLNTLRRQKHISHFTLQQGIDLMKELRPERGFFTHISHQLGYHLEIEKELPDFVTPAYDGLSISI